MRRSSVAFQVIAGREMKMWLELLQKMGFWFRLGSEGRDGVDMEGTDFTD